MSGVVADTSAWIDFFAGRPAHALEDALAQVGELRRRLRERGISVSTPDAHVAQCALDRDAVLLSSDAVFTRIARSAGLRLGSG